MPTSKSNYQEYLFANFKFAALESLYKSNIYKTFYCCFKHSHSDIHCHTFDQWISFSCWQQLTRHPAPRGTKTWPQSPALRSHSLITIRGIHEIIHKKYSLIISRETCRERHRKRAPELAAWLCCDQGSCCVRLCSGQPRLVKRPGQARGPPCWQVPGVHYNTLHNAPHVLCRPNITWSIQSHR